MKLKPQLVYNTVVKYYMRIFNITCEEAQSMYLSNPLHSGLMCYHLVTAYELISKFIEVKHET